MMRRTRWLIPVVAILTAIPLALLLAPVGCNNSGPPPLQTLPKTPAEEDEFKDPPTPAEKAEATDRLDKAIKAHGGPERLRKLKIWVQRMKGEMHYPNEGMVKIEQELKTQLPDRLRLWSKSFHLTGVQEGTITVSGNLAWGAQNGQPQALDADSHRDLQREIAFRQTLTLVPLKDAEFVLRPVEGEPVNQQPTVGILVTGKSIPKIRYYFDVKSNLLVRTLCRLWPEANQVQEREIHFSNYKAFDGLMLPTRYTDTRGGRIAINLEIDYTFPAELDPKEFKAP